MPLPSLPLSLAGHAFLLHLFLTLPAGRCCALVEAGSRERTLSSALLFGFHLAAHTILNTWIPGSRRPAGPSPWAASPGLWGPASSFGHHPRVLHFLASQHQKALLNISFPRARPATLLPAIRHARSFRLSVESSSHTRLLAWLLLDTYSQPLVPRSEICQRRRASLVPQRR